ncbi:MAG TPA: toll/interleukin-1 receptor domain-containing protein [Pyrinomonadaceae bacterium]|nr:toll/interleukin-1 receptor domain-containing protein [Pyrinomonadaceae bacterium]
MYPFRVFISYAREDQHAVQIIDALLREQGLVPVWDREIKPGRSFTDAIKKQIATAHVFMPLLTLTSQNNSWVHQEIGFAVGIDVPVLPLVLDQLPGEMMATIQAIRVKSDFSDLIDQLQATNVEALVLRHESDSELERLGISNRVANYSEERTELLVKNAEHLPPPIYVRQRALFSSFSLPDALPTDPLWDVIEPVRPRSEYHRRLLRRERRILESHARSCGCSLIICPFVDIASPIWAAAHVAQLKQLLRFFESMPDDKLIVGLSEGGIEEHINLLGDQFGAKALTPQPGVDYRQTSFTRHAPTVLKWLRDFDQELQGILQSMQAKPAESRKIAIARIEAKLNVLQS